MEALKAVQAVAADHAPLLRVVAFASIAAASLFYTWLWWYPRQFRGLISKGSDPCAVMAFWANVLKLLQFGSVALLTDWASVASLPPWQLAVSAALILAGQHLNFLVFKLLGLRGTYYGCRFGYSIPWVTAYPFGVVRDPQYTGSILTAAGAAFFAPREVCAFWAANYMYLMWLERAEPEGKAE